MLHVQYNNYNLSNIAFQSKTDKTTREQLDIGGLGICCKLPNGGPGGTFSYTLNSENASDDIFGSVR